MASLLTIIKFIINYLWAVAKPTLILVTTSWLLYCVNFNEDFRGFLSANIFAINTIFIYFLFVKDKYLEQNRFYLLFNIPSSSVFLSKLILLGIVFIIHFSIYLVVAVGINLNLFLTLISIIFLAILSKLIFFNVSNKFSRIVYFILVSMVFITGFFISNNTTLLIMLFFLLFNLFLTIRNFISPIN